MRLYFNLQKKQVVDVSLYLWGNPTYATNFSTKLFGFASKEHNGIFHVVGPDFVDRYTWDIQASKLMELNSSLITEDSTPHKKMKVPLPLKSNLSVKRFRNFCETVLHNLYDSLKLFKSNMEQTHNA